ncbi:MAG: FecR domain-containing protein [Oligoflexia bacterium]|nr:FecR domain-containing protein [Oligoflexia bacterium]
MNLIQSFVKIFLKVFVISLFAFSAHAKDTNNNNSINNINNKDLSSGDYTIDPKSSLAIPNYIGEVLIIKGRVTKGTQEEFQKQGKGALVSEGQKLYVNEVIRTAKKSMVKVVMVDESIITISENSVFTFNQFDFKTKNDRKSTYELIKGQFRAFFKNKNKGADDIKLLVGVTSMGVRGTTLLGNIYSNEKEDDVTQVAVVSGQVDLLNKNSSNTHNLKAGMHFVGLANVKDKKATESVVQLTDEEVKKLTLSADDEKSSDGPYLSLHKIVAINDKLPDSAAASAAAEAAASAARGIASIATGDGSSESIDGDGGGEKDQKDSNEQSVNWKNTLKNLNRTLNENNGKKNK